MVFGTTLSLLAQLRSCGGPSSLSAPADLLTGVDSRKLLGRAPEREALLRLLNSSADGDGGCTVLVGEAGIGETSLVALAIGAAADLGIRSLVTAGRSASGRRAAS